MSVMRSIILLIIVGLSHGLKYSTSYTNKQIDLYESYRVFTKQGIVSGGQIDISYHFKSQMSPSSSNDDEILNVNFMLLSLLQYDEWYDEMSSTSSDSFNVICQSPTVWIETVQFSLNINPQNPQLLYNTNVGNFSMNVHSTDEYTFVVAFCTLLESTHSFTIDIESSFLNLNQQNKPSQYLQIHEVILPIVFRYLTFIYGILIILLVYELGVNYKEIKSVHLAMLGAIVLQFTNLYIRYIEYDILNNDGKENYSRFGVRKALEDIIDPYCLFLYYYVTMVCMKRQIQLNRQNTFGVFAFWAFYFLIFCLHLSCQFKSDDWSSNGCQPYPVS